MSCNCDAAVCLVDADWHGSQGCWAHLARAGVKVTVAEAGWRSRNPVVVRQPLARRSRCSVPSCSRKGARARPVEADNTIKTLFSTSTFPGACRDHKEGLSLESPSSPFHISLA